MIRRSYLSIHHLIYAVPALIILILNGLILPMILILYPTRWGTIIGRCIKCKRLRNAGKTFVESINGSYKRQLLSGSRDYRAVSGIIFLLKAVIFIIFAFRLYGYHYNSAEPYVIQILGLIIMTFAAFSGLFRPYKTASHSLYDILLYCITALLFFLYSSMLLVSQYDTVIIQMFVLLSFLPLLGVLYTLLWSIVVAIHTRRT